jgi:hypothetical protein
MPQFAQRRLRYQALAKKGQGMSHCEHCQQQEAIFSFLTLLSRTPPFCHARDSKELGGLVRAFVGAFDLTKHRRSIWAVDHYRLRHMLQEAPLAIVDWNAIFIGMLAADLHWRGGKVTAG